MTLLPQSESFMCSKISLRHRVQSSSYELKQNQHYLKNEPSHFGDFGCGLLEAVEGVFGENEVPLLPPGEELVSLLPKESLLQGAEVGDVELLFDLKDDLELY